MTTLWVLSGGPEACPVIRRAQELGLRVVASDVRPEAPGLALADHGVIASVYDPDATFEAARSFAAKEGAPDGVLCAAADAPQTAARLADAFGLVGVDAASADLATDKLAMKERLADSGVPVPWFHPVRDAAHLAEIVRKEGRPLLVKPVDSRGARGVVRLLEDVDLAWAYDEARRHSPTDRVMVERTLPGPQVSTESLVLGERVETPGFADRNYELLETYAPFVVEDGGQLPTLHAADLQERTRALVARAADAIGLRCGVAKGDVVLQDGAPVIIEIAARLSGGYLCSHHIPLSTGVDFLGAVIRQAVGEPVDPETLRPTAARGVAQRYLFPTPGRVVAVHGEAGVATWPEVALLEVRVGPGDRVGPIENHPGRAGLVITTGETREAAIDAARDAVASITVETTP